MTGNKKDEQFELYSKSKVVLDKLFEDECFSSKKAVNLRRYVERIYGRIPDNELEDMSNVLKDDLLFEIHKDGQTIFAPMLLVRNGRIWIQPGVNRNTRAFALILWEN